MRSDAIRWDRITVGVTMWQDMSLCQSSHFTLREQTLVRQHLSSQLSPETHEGLFSQSEVRALAERQHLNSQLSPE